ncbi:hypothetical protein G6F51_014774 [Rhizopus arrhizus]|uniref:Uncharacterized protein n=1 Tax=Rhizopus oryzae TaxID=64495 RepID=A0A9P6XKW2_RHIOR|nr:hypothetical protein G6F51_014774 [Rhizopus arrhizus]
MGLRVQHQHAVAVAVALPDQRIQQLATHPHAARRRMPGPAADMAVGQQSARAHRSTSGGTRCSTTNTS